MKKIILAVFTVFISLTSFSQENKTDDVTTFYLITNAETKSDGDNKDDLTTEGIERAKKLVDVFSETKLDVIYINNNISTKQTAHSIAKKQKLGVYSFEDNQQYDAGFKYNTDGKNVLIIGNKKTVPEFANLVLGSKKYTTIKENTYGNLYIITVTKDSKTSVLLNIN